MKNPLSTLSAKEKKMMPKSMVKAVEKFHPYAKHLLRLREDMKIIPKYFGKGEFVLTSNNFDFDGNFNSAKGYKMCMTLGPKLKLVKLPKEVKNVSKK